MSGDGRSSCVDQILKAIDFGQLTYDETERRLQQLIDEETSQIEHPANADMLDACYSLLLQLHTHGSITYSSEKERNWQAIRQRVQAHRQRSDIWRKVGISAAAAFTLLFLGSLLHFHWFEGTSTPDGQQYVVQGHEITSQMIETAIAEHESGASMITVAVSQLQEELGFDPGIPQVLADTYVADESLIYFLPRMIQINTNYRTTTSDNYAFLYVVNLYSDVDAAYVSIEQDRNGIRTIINNQTVYTSVNMDNNVACWQVGRSVHNMSCSREIDSIDRIINDLLGGT